MKIEIRSDHVILDGYVNCVARDSRVLSSQRGPFIEQIVPKTFQRALEKGNNTLLLFNHKEDRELGSTKGGNLQLYEDNIGLRVKSKVYDPEVIEKARKKELRGWSFGFTNPKDRWEDTANGIQRRYIEDLDLLEVSILDKTPAYIATSIEMRGEESIIHEYRSEEFEAEIEDLAPKPPEEKREDPTNFDYSKTELEIELLKLKRY